MLDKHVVLTGLSGAGKSTVGRLLAERLCVGFVDTDLLVEKHTGRSVQEIFDKLGEAHFRSLESQMLRVSLDGPPVVIATGGGMMMSTGNRELVSKRAIGIWLQVDPTTAAARCLSSEERPLLAGSDPAATLRKLLEARREGYAEAAYTFQTDGLKPDVVANNIQRTIQCE